MKIIHLEPNSIVAIALKILRSPVILAVFLWQVIQFLTNAVEL